MLGVHCVFTSVPFALSILIILCMPATAVREDQVLSEGWGQDGGCLAGQEERAAGGGSSQPMGNSAWVGGLVSGGWSALEIFSQSLAPCCKTACSLNRDVPLILKSENHREGLGMWWECTELWKETFLLLREREGAAGRALLAWLGGSIRSSRLDFAPLQSCDRQ